MVENFSIMPELMILWLTFQQLDIIRIILVLLFIGSNSYGTNYIEYLSFILKLDIPCGNVCFLEITC